MLRLAVVALLMPGLAFWSPVLANPTGGVVVHGDVRFGGGGGLLEITQNSQRAIVNWADFSIDAGETTRFIQPGSSSAVLNRVTGGNPTAIHGALKANGNVFVVNPNGILVGAGGRIDVHGLALSTLDVRNGEFLAGGDLLFEGEGDAGVTNFGRINAIGGDVFLIGRTVANHGTISAPAGTVGLAAGSEVLLTAGQSPTGERLFVRAGRGHGGTGVLNDGSIEGAAVELKAHGNIYALAINNQGSVRATGVAESGGRVFLRGLGGEVRAGGEIAARAPTAAPGEAARVLIEAAHARVDARIRAEGGGEIHVVGSDRAEVQGTLDASAGLGEGGGGRIVVEGEEVALGSGARLDASGDAGGSVSVGGGFQGGDPSIRNAGTATVAAGAEIVAGAQGDGGAGTVVVWADGDTEFRGSISAEAAGSGDGGFVEVSGKRTLLFDGVVSTLSAGGGRTGTLLLDPTDFAITPGGGPATVNSIGSTTLVGLLGANNVAIATDSDGSEPGDITVQAGANVIWNNANALTLMAHRHIQIGANIQNAGSGGVHLVAGWDGVANDPGSPGASTPTGVITADSFAAGQFGNNGGSVYIGDGAQTQRISVGSKNGDTQVAAYDLILAGRGVAPNALHNNAHLGFFDGSNPGTPSGDVHAGDIWVDALNDVQVLGGGNGRGWAQIGHGGNDENDTGGSSYTGAITIQAGRDVLVYAPEIIQGGFRSYAQIGHGGAGNGGDHGGDIVVGAVRDLRLRGASGGNFAYAQIGHGGVESHGNFTGLIDVSAGDLVWMGGGDANNSYTQIGHGGQESTATVSADIHVAAGAGGIEATSRNSGANYAQIGHGGQGTNSALLEGAVTVVSVGDIRFDRNASNVDNAYAMIGHGGSGAIGEKRGDISVTSANGNILFGTDTSRTGRSGVQIGHGGRNGVGDTSGDITVEALAGDLRFHGVLADGDPNHREGYAQLGHGGRANLGNHGAADDLLRVVVGGELEFLAGSSNVDDENFAGREAYAQLGHGGYQSDGDHAGDIAVDVEGDILFDTRGSSGDRSYVQLGHGGFQSSGSFAGRIEVNQNTIGGGGAITFLAGRSASHAQLGHGGRNDHGSSLNNSDIRVLANADYAPGTITGDILVAATGDITFVGGFEAGGSGFAQLGHGGYHQSALADEGHSGAIEVRSTGGAVTLQGGTRNFQFAMIGHGGYESFGNHGGDITVEAAIGISLIGGGETITTGQGAASFAQIGHGGYGSNFEPVRNIAEVGVEFGAGGFHPEVPLADPGLTSGTITVRTTEAGADILLRGSQANDDLGRRSYAQIGHGGMDNDGDREGAVTVESGGSVLLERGRTDDAYVQIGHGGRSTSGRIADADITVTAANGGIVSLAGDGEPADGFAASRAYAQIGHGGSNARYDIEGSISVTADGGVEVLGGYWQESYAQIGHGGDGASSQGAGFHGAVAVTTNAGDIVLAANPLAGSSGNRTWAQIGHGGFASAASGGDFLGAVTVSALLGSVRGSAGELASNNYVQIGHGGVARHALNGHGGAISVTAGQDIVFSARQLSLGGGDRGHAMIGHGGSNSDGDHFGAITLEAGLSGSGGIAFTGGVGEGSGERYFAQVGHGGHNSHGDFEGDLELRAASDIAFLGGSGQEAYAMVGHGGTSSLGNREGRVEIVSTAGDISFVAGDNTGSFAQAGHGGRFGYGDLREGEVIVSALIGSVSVIGNALSNQSYAQIGHGGRHDRGQAAFAAGDGVGDITVNAGGSLTVQGGGGTSYGMVGHGGQDSTAANAQSGDIDIGAGTFVLVEGGRVVAPANSNGVAQIGHGGRNSAGTLDGAIRLDFGTDLSVLGGGTEADLLRTDQAAMIGHGGRQHSGSIDGDIEINQHGGVGAGDLTLTGGVSGNSFAQIGHGGYQHSGAIGTTSADIRIALQGEVSLEGGSAGEAYAQIGHGGRSHSGAIRGDLEIVSAGAGGGLSLLGNATGSVANHTYAQIGHGGRLSSGTLDGRIDLSFADGSVAIAGNRGTNAYAQIGHGGSDADGSIGSLADSGITLLAGGDIDLAGNQAGSGSAHTQIGHGGFDAGVAGNTAAGAITLTSIGGDVRLIGSNGGSGESYGQIGHGGQGSAYAVDDQAITVAAEAGSVTIQGSAAQNSTMIGHGGERSSGAASGDITVTAVGDISLIGGSNIDASTQIGHGGSDASGGTYAGEVFVVSESGAITLTGGSSSAGTSVQIGHGGYFNATGAADLSGAVRVVAGAEVHLDALGGGGIHSHARIGHGGYRIAGTMDGEIVVTSGVSGAGGIGGIFLTGGSTTGEYAQIGHGGLETSGAFSGSIRAVAAGGGDIVLAGGANADNYAMIGHGDGAGTSTGTRQGGVRLFADGEIAVNEGGAANAKLFHQSGDGLAAAAYLGGDGFQLIGNGGVTAPDSALHGLEAMILGNWADGPISVALANDFDLTLDAGASVAVDSAEHFNLLLGGSIAFLGGYQNSGSGDLTAVAGWDGSSLGLAPASTVDLTDPGDPLIQAASLRAAAVCDAIGHNNAGLTVGGGSQNATVSLGSRAGSNTFAGHSIELLGSSTVAGAGAQLGFFNDNSGAITGAIQLRVGAGGISLDAGAEDGAWVQIGHGGAGTDLADGIDADISISFCEAADLQLMAGAGSGAFAQVGHGGAGVSGETVEGIIAIDGVRDVNAFGGGEGSYVHLGHGGAGGSTQLFGDILLEASRDLAFAAGDGATAYAHLGHGGANQIFGSNDPSKAGDLTVTGFRHFSLLAGGGVGAYALAGHGGYFGRDGKVGDVILNGGGTGNLLVQGGDGVDAFAQIGLGGRSAINRKEGDVAISGVVDLSLVSGGGTRSYSHIGLGGANANGPVRGSIGIDIAGNLSMQAGDGANAYVQIGAGGTGQVNGHNINDAISIAAGGHIVLTGTAASSAVASYVQIGHGGHDSAGSNNTFDRSGDISVSAGGADAAGDAIRLSGGASNNSYVQIGHGGNLADAAYFGDITIEAAGNIAVEAGAAIRSYAQIGHGGRASRPADTAGHDLFDGVPDFGGDIDIATSNGGGLRVRGSQGATGAGTTFAYGQIGHGGAQSWGDSDGHILISLAGDLEVAGTDTADTQGNYAQIGHGGVSSQGSKEGEIRITSEGEGRVLAGLGRDSYAQIGHGGTSSLGDLDGHICVSVIGDLMLAAGLPGSDDRAYAQIGHGGQALAAAMSGDVTVVSANGGISLEGGGTAAVQYVQIGHGGVNSAGAMAGRVAVVAGGGDLQLVGGAANNSYAMTGHGAAATSSGTREGGVELFASGTIITTDGAGSNSTAHLFHQSGSGLDAADYLGGDGFQIVGNGGTELSAASLDGVGTMIGGNLGQGAITLALSGTEDLVLDFGGPVSLDTEEDFTLITGGNLTLLDSYQNFGSGDVTLVAGWDGTGLSGTVDLTFACDPEISVGVDAIDFNRCESFGQGDAMLVLGDPSQTEAVRVGSRLGTTTLAAHGLVMNASDTDADAATQVGYFVDGSFPADPGADLTDTPGAIAIHLQGGGLAMNAGAADGAYAQIGHGGLRAEDNRQNSPTDSTISISFCEPGDLFAHGGAGLESYAQIGHGSIDSQARNRFGDIAIEGFRNLDLSGGTGEASFAMIGNGGIEVPGGKRGDILLTGAGAGSHVSLRGGTGSAAGAGVDAYAQIGHGGRSSSGAKRGNVTLTGIEDLTLSGGDAERNYAQIGHGGHGSSSEVENFANRHIAIEISGDATLLGGSGSSAYAGIGHAGNFATSIKRGDIGLLAGGSVSLGGGGGTDANAFVGHSGRQAGGPRADGGEIFVSAAEGLSLRGGDGARTFAMIGHGGSDSRNADVEGFDITVVAGGTGIEVLGGDGQEAFALIGHGGDSSDASNEPDEGEMRGNVTVTASAGDIVLRANRNDTDGGNRAFAQIGHGGFNANDLKGNFVGDVTVVAEAGSVLAAAGSAANNNHVQIGHGGIANAALDGHRGDITVRAFGDISFTARQDVGVGGDQRGHAMIGHGGSNVDGDHFGAISLEAGTSGNGGIFFTGGVGQGSGERYFAQVGHGGHNSHGDFEGDLELLAVGDIAFLGGSGQEAYAMAGHGGTSSLGDREGRIEIVSAAGDITFVAGDNTGSFAQAGHGGRFGYGDLREGEIVVSALLGDVSVIGSALGNQSYAQIGHGGRHDRGQAAFAAGDGVGRIAIDAGGSLTVQGGGGTSYGMVGHGGQDSTAAGAQSGDIEIGVGTFVLVEGGRVVAPANSNGVAQIGHGGRNSAGALDGAIRLDFGTDLSVLGGGTVDDLTRSDQAAMIGHGGRQHSGMIEGDIEINQHGGVGAGDLTLAGGVSSNSFAQIGHGGHQHSGSIGAVSADIRIALQGGVVLEGGSASDTYAMIGHGGFQSNGAHRGEVSVQASGDIRVLGGDLDRSFAQIGHGGHQESGGGNSGGVSVRSLGGGVFVLGGSAEDANAMIGHGGRLAHGDHSGLVRVSGGAGVTVEGGGGERAFALVGHGGHGSDGNLSGDLFLNLDPASLLPEGGGALRVLGGSGVDGAFARVGHGAFGGTGSTSGNLAGWFEGESLLLGGSTADAYAQIGHGGGQAGSHGLAGEILALASAGGLALEGGSGDRAYARLGHGGSAPTGALAGDVFVNVDPFSGDPLGGGGEVSLRGGGGNASLAQIGHGGENVGGSIAGAIALAADSLSLLGGGLGSLGSSAQIGHGGRNGSAAASGTIDLALLDGDALLRGGAGLFATAQIGHGGQGYAGSVLDEAISLSGSGSLGLYGGQGGQAAALVGHGGPFSSGAAYGGDLAFEFGGDIALASGGDFAYAQIGHGGASSDAALSGDLVVTSGGSVSLLGLDPASGSYAQIGHGDDLRGPFAAVGGTGTREGDLTLAVGDDIVLSGALVGHLGPESSATVLGGVTYVGVSRDDPSDPDGGKLVADGASAFYGEDELRFYLPGRENNEVAAGASLGGVAYPGRPDLWLPQQPDEYAVRLVSAEGATTFLGEHDNSFGSGPFDPAIAPFAFYYDTLSLASVPPPSPPAPPVNGGPPGTPGDPDSFFDFVLDDRAKDDWRRKRQREYTGYGEFQILYEGFFLYRRDGRVRSSGFLQRRSASAGGLGAPTVTEP